MYRIRWNEGLWALLVLVAAAMMACGLAYELPDGLYAHLAGLILIPAALIAMLVEMLSPTGVEASKHRNV